MVKLTTQESEIRITHVIFCDVLLTLTHSFQAEGVRCVNLPSKKRAQNPSLTMYKIRYKCIIFFSKQNLVNWS